MPYPQIYDSRKVFLIENRDRISELISNLTKISNPTLIAYRLSDFIVAGLSEKTVNLYEAYLLNNEVIRFFRLGYTQVAWPHGVQISTCLKIISQCFLAYYFNDESNIRKLECWGREAYKLNRENRPHYIMGRFFEFLDAANSPELLTELQNIRAASPNLSFNKGPYHNEVFPYDFFSPELLLLEKDRSYACLEAGDGIWEIILALDTIG